MLHDSVFLALLTLVGVFVVVQTTEQFTTTASNLFSEDLFNRQFAREIPAAELRLPNSVKPISYDLTIKVYLPGYGYVADSKIMTFEGQLNIHLNVTQPTMVVTMNSLDLEFTDSPKIVTYSNRGKTVRIVKVIVDDTREKVHFHLPKVVRPTTNAVLKIEYRGKMREDLTGLYQTTYTTSKGEKKVAAVTKMEPVFARRMVPCFDEPTFKASWNVTVIHPIGTVALANGMEDNSAEPSRHVQPGFTVSRFQPTPKMSSYLLAIFVSEFEYNEGYTKNGIRFRVWSRPEEKNSTLYAVTAGVKCLEFYEKYYNLPFPLQKQDMVAIPDFQSGAMENWGLITYRENVLLYDEKFYTADKKRRVAVYIAHELAHQWFGNLVTLKWWNDLWLNEGFAILVEYLGTDEIGDGDYRMVKTEEMLSRDCILQREWFAMDALSTGLDADSVASSHPMTFKIDRAIDILDSSDSITYEKSGSVLAMIRKTMGEEHFNAGVHRYLKRHQYGNAEASDLFTALDEIVPNSVLGANGKKLNITEFAEPWTKQLGYPLVKAERINGTHIKLTQERFKILKTAEEEEKYRHPKWEFKWDVPIWYQIIGSQDVHMTWMKRNEPLVIKSDKAILLNAESSGFYRTGYSDSLWKEIVDTMNSNHLAFSPLTRVRIIEDAFVQATAGTLNYSVPLGLVSYLKNEKDYLPWSATLNKIQSLISMYGSDPKKAILQRFVIDLSQKSPAKKSVEYVLRHYKNYTNFFTLMSAQDLILNDCAMGNSDCSERMVKMFNDDVLNKCDNRILSECSDIPAPFRAEAYCQAVKNGNEKTFEKMFEWYKNERNQVEKSNLMNSLACSRDIITLKKLMLDAMKKEGSMFRLQDCSNLFSKICSNDAASDSMLNFLISRWDEMLVRLSKNRRIFRKVIGSIINTIKTKEGLDQLQKFEASVVNVSQYDLSKLRETVEVKVAWRENNLKFVTEFIEKSL